MPLAAPKELPGSLMRAKTKLKEAHKSSTELFEGSENHLKIKHVNVHKTIENKRGPLFFQAPKANLELRFASKKLLASDFEALEVFGAERRPGEPAIPLRWT